MNWGENFWIWMATEAFFGAFVAALLYYFFVYVPKRDKERNNEQKED
jgi:hypothetical protein